VAENRIDEEMQKEFISSRSLRKSSKYSISSSSNSSSTDSSINSTYCGGKISSIEREIVLMQKKTRILELERILRQQGKEVNRRNLKEL